MKMNNFIKNKDKNWQFFASMFGVFSLALLSISAFIVYETEICLITEFGKPVRSVKNAGLYFSVPFIQKRIFLDRRILSTTSPAREILALDQKRLIIDAYAKYKIEDPIIFYRALKDESTADMKITSILDSSLRQIVASNNLSSLLSSSRKEIMSKVTEMVESQSRSLGISILDVRIVRADLPEENSVAIFERMKTAREKEATELRAQGEEEAKYIIAKADRAVRTIMSEAKQEAELIKGNADKKSYEIITKSFGSDLEFYKFYRNIKAYEEINRPDNTHLILSTNSEIMKNIKSSN
jgi:membrane protease subunit HflC